MEQLQEQLPAWTCSTYTNPWSALSVYNWSNTEEFIVRNLLIETSFRRANPYTRRQILRNVKFNQNTGTTRPWLKPSLHQASKVSRPRQQERRVPPLRRNGLASFWNNQCGNNWSFLWSPKFSWPFKDPHWNQGCSIVSLTIVGYNPLYELVGERWVLNLTNLLGASPWNQLPVRLSELRPWLAVHERISLQERAQKGQQAFGFLLIEEQIRLSLEPLCHLNCCCRGWRVSERSFAKFSLPNEEAPSSGSLWRITVACFLISAITDQNCCCRTVQERKQNNQSLRNFSRRGRKSIEKESE